ncbi:MAG: M48 family metalloprotease [Sphingomonadales bacterium]|nr:M48 family metalloprotease [Sphingomonadales bacterium]MDE2569836.1 M48 family metalloprotease [Sphingomonadales bacterium]
MRLPAFVARFAAVLAVLSLTVSQAAAQSILRDAETEKLLDDLARPLILAAGLDPRNVDIVLVNDPSVNAFVAGGQAVYINSGLIGEADDANEVQGVIAHELGHVTGGHAVRGDEGAKPATGITLLSLVLGLAAAAAGAGEAGMGVIAAGQQAALGKYLAFSRAQESAADAAGASYLSKAGISGKGSIDFFKKLQNLEYRYGFTKNDLSEFYSTHPMTDDRLTRLQDVYEKDPAWNAKTPPGLEDRFQRIKAKLYGYLADPQDTLRAFPTYVNTIPAHYARAYAYHKEAFLDKALGEADALLKAEPQDPYFLELKGQILLESGKPQEAIPPLREATDLTSNQPLIATTFGHALIATEDKANYPEAERVLKAAVVRDHDNPFAWYNLGVVYEALGEHARARLASAEQQYMEQQYGEALRSAVAAEQGLPTGSPDFLRAQDIEMSARAEVEQQKKKR